MKTSLNQKERLLELFHLYGGTLTLGKLLETDLGYKCTSRFSDLRKDGHQIEFRPGKTPSENSWTLRHWNKEGQGTLL